jgi:hypothetical protein
VRHQKEYSRELLHEETLHAPDREASTFVMKRIEAIGLALALVREELAGDQTAPQSGDADGAVGLIFRHLSALPDPTDESATEEMLERFLRIAAAAVEVIAELAAETGKEGA